MKEGISEEASISAAFGAVDTIHLGNPGLDPMSPGGGWGGSSLIVSFDEDCTGSASEQVEAGEAARGVSHGSG